MQAQRRGGCGRNEMWASAKLARRRKSRGVGALTELGGKWAAAGARWARGRRQEAAGSPSKARTPRASTPEAHPWDGDG